MNVRLWTVNMLRDCPFSGNDAIFIMDGIGYFPALDGSILSYGCQGNDKATHRAGCLPHFVQANAVDFIYVRLCGFAQM